jgi:GntR family transcriptional regulator/MocR family aminotransferase
LKTSSDAELLVMLDRAGSTPLHRQLQHELRAAVHSGRLAAGTAMPSSRALANSLGLSRGVVVEAYEQLIAEGYLTSRAGGATRVARDAVAVPPATAVVPAQMARIAFRYGRPDVSEFPRAAWLRSLRRVLTEAPADRLNYMDGRGVPEVRQALAAYLNRVRGTAAVAERMVVCAGFAQGMALLCQVLRTRGARRIALEDPSDDSLPAMVRLHGLEVVPLPVDEAGACVDALTRSGADAVLVTAAHQFPLGGVLPPERRSALVAWAKASNALIIEDDYDAEYRYDREPIGAIQGLAPERVVYVGSASKTLAPGLRLGWLLLAPDLIGPVADAKELADRGSPSIDQLAFADFLERGEFDHHLRRMRPIYRRRRDLLLRALARHAPELRPVGASAGLHITAWLPPDVSEEQVIADALRLGVYVDGLQKYRLRKDDAPGGLIFGYSNVPERLIDDGVRVLAEAISGARQVA